MHKKNVFTKKNMTVFIITIFLVITVAIAFGYKFSKNSAPPQQIAGMEDKGEKLTIKGNISKVVLSVEEMSCSGCIATIKESLADLPGIVDIFIDVGGGKAEIYYDREKLREVSRVEEAMTANGYPAKVQGIITAEEIIKENNLAAQKSQYYIASISGYDISRADFDAEINAARTKYEKKYGKDIFSSTQGIQLLDRLKVQVVKNLINEGILLQEISRAGYKVENETVEMELQKHLNGTGKSEEEFRAALMEAGYDFDYYKARFELKLLINRYLNEKILTNAASQFEKQNQFNSWYKNVKKTARVVYYDKDLEHLVQKQSTSSSCCSTG